MRTRRGELTTNFQFALKNPTTYQPITSTSKLGLNLLNDAIAYQRSFKKMFLISQAFFKQIDATPPTENAVYVPKKNIPSLFSSSCIMLVANY